MSAAIDRGRVSHDDVAAAVAAALPEGSASAGVLIAAGEPLAIVWANAAAANLFGSDEADVLSAQIVSGQRRGSIGESLPRLQPGAPARLERLRIARRFRSCTVTVALTRATTVDGEALYVMVVPATEPRGVDPRVSVLKSRTEPDVVEPSTPSVLPGTDLPRSAPAIAPAAWLPAGMAALRVLWRCDPEGRIVAMDNGHPAIAGTTGDALLGRALTDILAEFGADPEGRAAQGLASGRSWSGVSVAWPLAGGTATVPALLGATPVLDPARTLTGFRGFALFDLSHAPGQPGSAEATNEPVASGPVAATEAAVGPAPGSSALDAPPDARAEEPRQADAAPGTAPPLLEAPANRPAHAWSKVVALRPYQSLAAVSPRPETRASGLEASPDDPGAPAPSIRADLTPVEQSNFQEIRRTLEAGTGAAPGPADASSTHAVEGPGVAVEARSAIILDLVPTPVLLVTDGRVAYANRAGLVLTGYESAAALDAAGGTARAIEAAAPDQEGRVVLPQAAGPGLEVTGRVASFRDGGRRHVVFTAAPGAPAPSAAPRRAIDAVAEPVLLIGLDGAIAAANPAAEILFGQSATDLLGQPLAAMLVPDSQASARTVLADARSGRPGGAADVVGRGPRGASAPLRLAIRRLDDTVLCATFSDRGALAEAARELAQARQDAASARSEKPDFLAKVSHEIRTPLNAILGFAEVILDERFGPIGNARYRDYLQDIHDAGRTVMTLVGDLLDLSKIEAGQRDMAAGPVDVNRTVGFCVAAMQPAASRERVIMRMSLAPRLPPALVDETALKQVLTNILSNAVKFNEPGGQVIVSTTVGDGGAVAVRIRDTGIGMSETDIATAMEPFRQLDTTKPNGGNGLGLPLTKALVEANGAAMTIKSRKDEGTLVEIALRPCPADLMRVPAE